jgi:inhibitor of growth protein 3
MQITPSQDSIMDRIGGLGLDVDGSREGSNLGGRSANATPTLGHSSVLGEKARSTRVRAGIKRSRADEDEDDESDGEEEDVKPAPKRNGGKKAGVAAAQAQAQDVEVFEGDGEFGPDGEVDSKVYCTCRQVSYGEMIGCDDDDCEIEWVSGSVSAGLDWRLLDGEHGLMRYQYHLSCLGLPKPPEGNWICPQCAERRKKQPRGKKPAKVKGRAK